jgi:hypothetical protein
MKDPHLQAWASILICFVGIIFSLSAYAEEGMGMFDNPPGKRLQEKYGFAVTPQWLDHTQLASVRFNDGGSGSFVIRNS